MLWTALIGKTEYSLKLKLILENEYSNMLEKNGGDRIGVKFFVSETACDDADIKNFKQLAESYEKGELAAVVIPKWNHMSYNGILLSLIKYGIDVMDIYNSARLYDGIEKNETALTDIIVPVLDDSYLSYLEYHVADHCNLNCKYCTHYSPLVDGPVFTDFESFAKDLKRLRELIADIGVIRILGGEPTLNPELPRFVELTRKIYPGSVITVVTNGMLLDRLPEELFESMRENKAFFHISYYPPFECRINDIQKKLVEKKVPCTISPVNKSFRKTQVLNNTENYEFFYDCFQATCTCLHQGKIAPCYAPFTTKYFNSAFGTDIPENEGLDIYSPEVTVQNVKSAILGPMNRCGYCTDGIEYPWEVVGKRKNIEDWV